MILAASSWRTNADLIADVARLGYLPSPVLDATYCKGTWWKVHCPSSLTTNDLFKPADVRSDFRRLPFADGTFASVAFDPPYMSKGGRSTSTIDGMDDAYGMQTTPNSPLALQRLLINPGLTECARVTVPGGFIVVKCMDYVSSGKIQPGTFWTWHHAKGIGLELVDRFVHVGGPGPQPKSNPDGSPRRQAHARNNCSTMFVFRTPKAKAARMAAR